MGPFGYMRKNNMYLLLKNLTGFGLIRYLLWRRNFMILFFYKLVWDPVCCGGAGYFGFVSSNRMVGRSIVQ